MNIQTLVLMMGLAFVGGCVTASEDRSVGSELLLRLDRLVKVADGKVLCEGMLSNTSTSMVQISRFGLRNAMLRVTLVDPKDESFSTRIVPSQMLRDPPRGNAYFMEPLDPGHDIRFRETISGSLNLQGREMPHLKYSVSWVVNMRDSSGHMGKALVQGSGIVNVEVQARQDE